MNYIKERHGVHGLHIIEKINISHLFNVRRLLCTRLGSEGLRQRGGKNELSRASKSGKEICFSLVG